MQNPDDFALLKSNDKSLTKLELDFQVDTITDVDWYELRTAIEGNTVVKEVHLRISKEFVEAFPLAQLLDLCTAIGSLASLKYLLVGQMQGDVQVFGHLPVQAMTAMLASAGEKLLWWYLRGVVVTHIYKGSDEEEEDKSGVLEVSQTRETRTSGKEKKKKDKKDKKDKKKSSKDKDKKKSSKKEKKGSSSTKSGNDSMVMMDESSRRNPGPILDKKQAAAKRAMEKLGDSLLCLKNLKRVSLMGHFDDCLYGCQLDPILEGLGAVETLESFMSAITRHEGRILVDPHSLGSFLDGASPKLKDVSILYIELTDDHMFEISSAMAKKEDLKELTLSGTGSTAPEPVGALFAAPYLQKLVLQELTLDSECVVAMSIALAHYSNLKTLEIQCHLQSMEVLALQQMVAMNSGLECLHLHVTSLGPTREPLDIVASLFSNVNSKLKTVIFEGEDKNENVKKLREVPITDWEEVLEGFFNVASTETNETRMVTFTRI